MSIVIIRQPATDAQIIEMRIELGEVIKVAVDIERQVLAGGGELHADCEQSLLEDGSNQSDVWGGDWYSVARQVGFESLINIRPRQGNRSLEIQSPELRRRFEAIVRRLLEVQNGSPTTL